jgi:hypothetical protein
MTPGPEIGAVLFFAIFWWRSVCPCGGSRGVRLSPYLQKGEARPPKREGAVQPPVCPHAHFRSRRDLIALLASTAATWPLGARAQQTERMRRIGVLTNIAEDDLEARARIAAFNKRLHQLGWVEDRNLQIETRFALGDANLTRKYAAELVALSPDVILAVGIEVTSALQHATTTVPIVFVLVPDPVGAGIVERMLSGQIRQP